MHLERLRLEADLCALWSEYQDLEARAAETWQRIAALETDWQRLNGALDPTGAGEPKQITLAFF